MAAIRAEGLPQNPRRSRGQPPPVAGGRGGRCSELGLLAALVAAALLAPAAAGATNGYFSHGYGIKAKGMGGAGIAFPQDALAAATNPAGMALVGTRLDAGLDWFLPDRGTEITGNALPGFNGAYSGNGTASSWIPELAANWATTCGGRPCSLGISLFGNGGMNTTYNASPFGALGGTSPAGVDLMQVFVAPSFAIRVVPDLWLGVSPYAAYQTFNARGLQPFAGFSGNPARLTNQGGDSSTGWGVRVGAIWELRLAPIGTCRLGATYQTKTRMSPFDKYAGLLSDAGDFDIPSNWGAGASCPIPSTGLTWAVDYVRIVYSGVAAVHNPSFGLLFAGVPLGAANGPGFGWRDMNVFKLGLSWANPLPGWTFRAGYNHGGQPVPAGETLFNSLAPGVVENHFTLGATFTIPGTPRVEVSGGGLWAPKTTVSGSGSIPAGAPPAGLGGGEANIRLAEWSLGLAAGVVW